MATLKVSRRGFMVGATMAGTSLLVGCTLGDIVGAGAHTKVGAFGPFSFSLSEVSVSAWEPQPKKESSCKRASCSARRYPMKRALMVNRLRLSPMNAMR